MWFGWAFHAGEWHRLTGPHPDLGACHRALNRELAALGRRVPSQDAVMTQGHVPDVSGRRKQSKMNREPDEDDIASQNERERLCQRS
jgi:hypothetical protein